MLPYVRILRRACRMGGGVPAFAMPAYRPIGRREMIIWMEVTKDEYELPIAVADTAQELAKMCGTTANNVMSSASHHKRVYYELRLHSCKQRQANS